MVVESTPLLGAGSAAGVPPGKKQPWFLWAGATADDAPAPFAARVRAAGNKFPQAVAHRGFNAACPENSMLAFQRAVETGAQGLETDLHLSKDGVVVLSHDPSLKRCFGRPEKVADCDWEFLSQLKTKRQPEQGLARLYDLLTYLNQPELASIWLLLDIKIDNDAEELFTRIGETIASVPSPGIPWAQRIIIGCWNKNFIERSREILPQFPVMYIGASLYWAAKFLKVPGVHFNLGQRFLVGPLGDRFLKAAKKAGRKVAVWTVNKEEWMEWSIRHEVDAVVTDNPKKFLEICGHWEEEDQKVKSESGGTRAYRGRRLGLIKRSGLFVEVLLFNVLFAIFFTLYYRRFQTAGLKTKPDGKA